MGTGHSLRPESKIPSTSLSEGGKGVWKSEQTRNKRETNEDQTRNKRGTNKEQARNKREIEIEKEIEKEKEKEIEKENEKKNNRSEGSRSCRCSVGGCAPFCGGRLGIVYRFFLFSL